MSSRTRLTGSQGGARNIREPSLFGDVGEESCNGVDKTKGMSLVNYSLFGLGCRPRFGLELEEFIWAWVQNDHDSKPPQVLIILIELKLGKVLSHDYFAPKPK